MNITLLIGLPGSGKTYFGKSTGLKFFDDISQNGGIKSLEGLNEDCIISDCFFVFPDTRELARKRLQEMFPSAVINEVYFENSPEKCWANVERRNDGRIIIKKTFDRLSRLYEIPEGCCSRKIWEPPNDS